MNNTELVLRALAARLDNVLMHPLTFEHPVATVVYDRRVLEERRAACRPASFERRREIDSRVQIKIADIRAAGDRFSDVPVRHAALRERQ
jgi:hypothetical protein